MILEIVAALVILTGVFFLAVAAAGFRRLPDIFCRLHVMGIIDTLGAPLVLLGAAIHVGAELTAGKLILALVFIAITSPVVGHLLARAALEAGHRPDLIENPTEVPARFAGEPGRKGPKVLA